MCEPGVAPLAIDIRGGIEGMGYLGSGNRGCLSSGAFLMCALHASGLPWVIAAFGDGERRRTALMTPRSRFVSPRERLWRTPWTRRPDLASDWRRRRLIRAFISFFGDRRGSWRRNLTYRR